MTSIEQHRIEIEKGCDTFFVTEDYEYELLCGQNKNLCLTCQAKLELLASIEQDIREELGKFQSKANVVSEEKLWFFMSDFEQFKENLLGGNKNE